MRAILTKRIQQVFVVFFLATLGGCSKASDVNEARHMPKLAPPASADVPTNVTIAVDVDGRPAAAIDAQRLSSTPPDFKDAQRRAWKLSGLVGSAAQGALVEIAVVGADGVAVTFPRPASSTDPQPVLMENRRGELVATMVAPEKPFPAYHNEGGRLHRPGDSTPRIEHVAAVHVRTHSAVPQAATK
jgi:hypothetical protein